MLLKLAGTFGGEEACEGVESNSFTLILSHLEEDES